MDGKHIYSFCQEEYGALPTLPILTLYVILLHMGETGRRIIAIILSIPSGKVMSYSDVAREAGIHRGARTVARILHSSSRAYKLPWWRVIRADGTVAQLPGDGRDEQIARLKAEGHRFGPSGKIILAAEKDIQEKGMETLYGHNRKR